MNRALRVVFVLAMTPLATSCDSLRASRARARVPHIVLVTIDTLHVNWAGPYNDDVENTPFLNRFADEGVRFEHAYTHAPITLPSHAALMTGVSPPALGVMANGDRLPDRAETLAEILRGAEYKTAAFISLGVLQASFGMDQGFEHFHDPFVEGPIRWYRRAHEIAGPVERWLEDNHEEPFFLWVHVSDPHEPYVTADATPDTELWLDDALVGRFNLTSAEQYPVPIELAPGDHELRWRSLREPTAEDRPETGLELLLLSRESLEPYADVELPESHVSITPSFTLPLSNKDEDAVTVELLFAGRLNRPTEDDVFPAYEANVARADRYLSELDALLESYGIRDDTLFAIVSDHGEGLFSHTILGHASHVYEDQLRIVWMMRGADVPEGLVIRDRVGLMTDVAPTILDIVGLPRRPDMEGDSLAACWSGAPCPENEPWWSYGVSHESRGLTGMASYRWPYKWMWRRGFKRIAFDVTRDPWETEDLLANPGPHNPEPLKSSAESFRAERRRLAKALAESRRTDEADEHERLLKSLGYLGGEKP